jgi:hypothetical protein
MRKIVQRIVPLLVILFLLNFTLNAQNQIITGTVTGEGNKPLLGATITLKGTSKAVTTNDEGKYSIEAKMGDEIVVSSVGHLLSIGYARQNCGFDNYSHFGFGRSQRSNCFKRV